jgi:hypothetical protein
VPSPRCSTQDVRPAIKSVGHGTAHTRRGRVASLGLVEHSEGGAELARIAADLANDPAVREFAGRLVGTPVQEAGELLADHIRFRRWKAELRILGKALDLLKQAGIDPRQVDLKVLAPIVEYSSLEDDESLTDKWAALLANASTEAARVPPSFPDVLRELTPGEARLLDVLYDLATDPGIVPDELVQVARDPNELAKLVGVTGWPMVAIDNLLRLRLVSHGYNPGPVASADVSRLTPTAFGRAFVAACRRPAPNE